VQKALGLPNGSKPIKYNFEKPERVKDPHLFEMFTDKSEGKQGSIPYNKLTRKLEKDSDLDDTTYGILFMQQTFCHYLAPMHNRNLERCFLSIFENVPLREWKDMKWCDFFMDFLIHGIRSYKKSTAKYRKCHGVVHLLAVSNVLAEWF
jgi:phosphatidylinositol kinase/protein kinase (PI-3  family)